MRQETEPGIRRILDLRRMQMAPEDRILVLARVAGCNAEPEVAGQIFNSS